MENKEDKPKSGKGAYGVDLNTSLTVKVDYQVQRIRTLS